MRMVWISFYVVTPTPNFKETGNTGNWQVRQLAYRDRTSCANGGGHDTLWRMLLIHLTISSYVSLGRGGNLDAWIFIAV